MARAKERLRIYSSADDADLAILIETAILVIEKATGLIIRQSTWDLIGNCLPLEIKAKPVRSITGIYYDDSAEAEQTIGPSNYYFLEGTDRIEIFYISGFYGPADMSTREGCVRVRFTAGYDDGSLTGADPNLTLPPQIELAVLFLVGIWYENREGVGAEDRFKVPKTFDYIVSQLKVYN